LRQSTAILIFANSARYEARRKGFRKGEKLFSYFTEKTITEVKKTGLPFYLCTEDEQKGTSFGQRLKNAINNLYSKGYTTVIAIGNDSPNLSYKHINTACQQLKSNELVLGPSLDGGVYLVGIHQQIFNANTFEKLDWNTSNLATNLVESVAKNTTQIAFLETLADVDNLQDLGYFWTNKEYCDSYLQKILSQYFQIPTVQPYYYNKHSIPLYLSQALFNKGSPLSLS
jgi:glycosyltransferase A (GT-A) superfamily protein (DUF2064 family)